MTQSIPKDPAQPEALSYPFSSLQLVPSYTVDSYQQTFGEPPPPPDAKLPYKSWFDSSAATEGTGQIAYTIGYNFDRTPQVLVIPKALARRVNLPQPLNYSPYTPTPTPATLTFRGMSTSAGAVDPQDLASHAEAEALAAELGGVVADFTPVSGMLRFEPNGETRREFAVLWPDGTYELVGNLLVKRNRFGLGAPVKLDASGRNWEQEAQNTEVAPGPPCPAPLRQLLPDEQITQPLIGEPVVVRSQPQIPQASGAFTETDRAILKEILRVLRSKG